MNKKILISAYAFALCFIILCFSIPVYASGGETLTVNAAWVDGELLRINVTDINGVNSALALRLSDYVSGSETKEYISIQAVDLDGNKSEIIEIKNPFYDPSAAPVVIVTPAPNDPPQQSQSGIGITNGNNQTSGLRPFTPDGTGTVMDNATDGDGKEFFTIDTEDGSVFYLIIDRQRNTDNVYLLNAVTIDDLVALAARDGRELTTNANNSGASAVPNTEQSGSAEGQTPTTAAPSATEPPGEKSDTGGNNNNMIIFVVIAALIAGGAGYYFKIVRGRKNVPDTDDDDEDEDYAYEDEPEEPDYEEYTSEDGGDEE